MLLKLRLCAFAPIAVLALTGCNKAGTPSPQSRGGMAVVVGGIIPCSGLPARGGPRYAAGTVSVLRGRLTKKTIGRGSYDFVFPKRVVGKATVGQNTPYRFVLSPGHYIFRASYLLGNVHPFAQVTLKARTVSHIDIPNMCR
jgi:hypothetical protein